MEILMHLSDKEIKMIREELNSTVNDPNLVDYRKRYIKKLQNSFQAYFEMCEHWSHSKP